MFIATHKKISECIYDMLSDEFSQYIDMNSMIKGSYFPDVNFKYTVINHDYEGTITIVNKHLKFILEKKLPSKELGWYLGIICHFVSDYCSPYHPNNHFKKRGLVEHLIYENKTNNYNWAFEIHNSEYKKSFFTGINKMPLELKNFIDKHMQSKKTF